MFNILDKWVEKKLKIKLHKQRKIIIGQTLDNFILKYHPDEATLNDFRGKLESEADRIFAIADRSIIHERVKRAKYVFWITAIVGLILSGTVIALTEGAALPIIIPLLTALVAWLVSLITIPNTYKERIQGSMDAAMAIYDKTMAAPSPLKARNEISRDLIQELKESVDKMNAMSQGSNTAAFNELSTKVEKLNHNVDVLTQKVDLLEKNMNSLTKEMGSLHREFALLNQSFSHPVKRTVADELQKTLAPVHQTLKEISEFSNKKPKPTHLFNLFHHTQAKKPHKTQYKDIHEAFKMHAGNR